MNERVSRRIDRFDDLVDAILAGGTTARRLIAICGAPGSGKSTLAEALEERINHVAPDTCVTVPMDGFHLDDAVLSDLKLQAVKGAPQTFDCDGFIALHRRLAAPDEDAVAVPLFDRSMEIARAGARLIPRATPLVLVEGNYLLLRHSKWEKLASFYALTVRVDVDPDELERRLLQRWTDQNLAPAIAKAKVLDNDLPNARLVVDWSKDPDILYRPMRDQKRLAGAD